MACARPDPLQLLQTRSTVMFPAPLHSLHASGGRYPEPPHLEHETVFWPPQEPQTLVPPVPLHAPQVTPLRFPRMQDLQSPVFPLPLQALHVDFPSPPHLSQDPPPTVPAP